MFGKEERLNRADQGRIIQEIQAIIDNYVNLHENVSVFEAGAGSCSAFSFASNILITGLDISENQLSKNAFVHEKIIGDIQTFYSEKRYDIVLCWNVLEHVENPKKALFNLINLTKLNGILIISAPNVYSLKGMITKLTPYWFHKWVYKFFFKSQRIPFQTYLRLSMSPYFLRHYFRNYKFEYVAYLNFKLRGTLNQFYRIIISVLKLISLGHWDADLAQYYFVIRKT